MVRPTTGAPPSSSNGRTATYMGTKYELKYSYEAETTYVLGASSTGLVSQGRRPATATLPAARACSRWSKAAMRSPGPLATRSPATRWPRPSSSMTRKTCCSATTRPFVAKSGMGCGTIIPIAVVIIIPAHHPQPLLQLDPRVENCSSSSSYRSSGGSYGGYSSAAATTSLATTSKQPEFHGEPHDQFNGFTPCPSAARALCPDGHHHLLRPSSSSTRSPYDLQGARLWKNQNKAPGHGGGCRCALGISIITAIH